MATTDQHARHSTTRPAPDDAEGIAVPAWPTRDLERRAARSHAAEPATTADDPAPGPEPTTASTTEATTQPTTELDEEATVPVSTTAAAPAVSQRPARSRASTFLADLTRAMRVAAEEERASVLARFRDDAGTYVEQMRGEFSAAADGARARADADVTSLEAWCAAELERIRRETEQGIAARRSRLDAELAAQTTRLDEGVATVDTTVSTFERDMAAFFERLLAEEDPSTFAVMAGHLPEPPAFAAWPPKVGPVDPFQPLPALDPEVLAAAEAEAAEALAAEGYAFAAPAATAAWPATPAQAEAEAAEGATRPMIVAAVGLVSVASVSAFKRTLSQVDGVRAVQVSSGPQGEFIFTLACEPGLDLAAAVCALPGFEVELRDSSEDSVTIVARDLDTDA